MLDFIFFWKLRLFSGINFCLCIESFVLHLNPKNLKWVKEFSKGHEIVIYFWNGLPLTLWFICIHICLNICPFLHLEKQIVLPKHKYDGHMRAVHTQQWNIYRVKQQQQFNEYSNIDNTFRIFFSEGKLRLSELWMLYILKETKKRKHNPKEINNRQGLCF